ncbi:21 kDa protein-like [Typha angustifolia]|uniref:21 kDa protein-like n=1 Tax=Typha angustifolia TaxID=59011 RepID=UPI003C30D628
MASSFSLILLTLISFMTSNLIAIQGARVIPHEQKSINFIKSSCSATEYPALCFNSLSAHASTIQTSPMQLARTALYVSLAGARSASTAMARMSAIRGKSSREAAAMRDCVENMGDSVDELKSSIDAMQHMRGKKLRYQINSINTWVSAALTDESTCMNGFDNTMKGNTKVAVRSMIVKVAQLTCNALALVNRLSSIESSSP